jgi:hypothetical protein
MLLPFIYKAIPLNIILWLPSQHWERYFSLATGLLSNTEQVPAIGADSVPKLIHAEKIICNIDS